MKRLALVFLVLAVAAAGAFAVDFTTFQTGFDQFAQDLANGAPFNSSTGLNWSQAYIGQFPHFGIGLTVGATTIPAAAVTEMVNALGITLPSEFSYVQQYGVPLPSYTIEARIGGFVLPFDIGLKLGYIPPDALQKLGVPFSADYILAGADVRIGLLKDEGFLPAISVGVGYDYLRESVSASGLMPGGVSVTSVAGHNLTLSDPALAMAWATNVLSAKAEISKRILFFSPYIGAAVSYSFGANASGAVNSQLLYDGSPITQAQIDQINQYYTLQGKTPPNLSSVGITANAASGSGFAYRLFGGISLDLFVVYLDLGGAYDLATGAYGASVNLRLAL
jgi:hypothetical protein